MNDINSNTNLEFPSKPILKENSNSLIKSIGSLALFIGAFYMFFNKDIKFILILVIVLFIHELGHFLAMKHFNYKEVKMFFIPLLGALVTGKKQQISQKQRAIVLLAGPIPGILIGIVLLFYGVISNSYDITTAGTIFVFLNIFNLLPVTPLDGGNLIETLFFGSRELLKMIFTGISAAGLILIAVYSESYFLLIIPFFLLMKIRSQTILKEVKKSLKRKKIEFNKPYEELADKEYWLIREEIITSFGAFKNVPRNKYEASKYEKQITENIKALESIEFIRDLSILAIIMVMFIWILFFIIPLLLYVIGTAV